MYRKYYYILTEKILFTDRLTPGGGKTWTVTRQQKALQWLRCGRRRLNSENQKYSESSFFMTGISEWLVYDLTLKSQAHVRVQWVANPLSVHVYFVLASRVDQVRDSALHRIELETSRLYNPTLSTTVLSGRCAFASNPSKYSKELTNRASHRLQ